MDLSDYKKWLEREGYCASTVRESVRRLDKTALGSVPEQQRHMWPYLSRYLRFVVETKKEPLGSAFTKRLRAYGLQPAKKRQLSGKRRRKRFSGADFAKLRAHLRAQKDPTSRLLLAYMFTDLRISAFLFTTTLEIVEAVKDKKSRDWLLAFGVFHTYAAVSDTARGAYVRLRYKIMQEAKALGLSVDLNTLHQYKKSQAVGGQK